MVTEKFAIKVVAFRAWKQSLGLVQTLAIDTGKEPVLALIRPPNWTDYQAVVHARHLREKYIGSMGVRLFVLTAMDDSQARIRR